MSDQMKDVKITGAVRMLCTVTFLYDSLQVGPSSPMKAARSDCDAFREDASTLQFAMRGKDLYVTVSPVDDADRPEDNALVEKVARAIVQADEQNGGPCWDHLMTMGKHVVGHVYDQARAAIKAMR